LEGLVSMALFPEHHGLSLLTLSNSSQSNSSQCLV
jgi:hypothetical protein